MIDLHTHTKASDGELTVEELLSHYTEKGIGFGVADHLFRGNLRVRRDIAAYLSRIEELPVYRGCEIDLGCMDFLPDNLEDRFQYRILSTHSVRLSNGEIYSLEPYFAYRADSIGSYQNCFQPDMAKCVLEQLLYVYESDLNRRPIEILGHCTATPFHEALVADSFLDEWEDAFLVLCEKHHVAIEINSLWKSPGLRMVQKAAKHGIKMSCGSDCHHAQHATNLAYTLDIIRQAGLIEDNLFQP